LGVRPDRSAPENSGMDEPGIQESVAEILGVTLEELTPDVELKTFATYDSTAQLSLMVCLSDFGFRLEPNDLRKLRTYGDILKLINQGSGNGQDS
jgi:acyl carrier protein